MASSILVRKVMQGNAGRETKPEKRLRSVLQKLGLRFRNDLNVVAGIRCKADIVFRRARVGIFVDGCFWHGCPVHFRAPKTNTEWWQEKIEDNIRRDERQTAKIQNAGWVVVRLWEHEVNGKNIELVARRIKRIVVRRVLAGKGGDEEE